MNFTIYFKEVSILSVNDSKKTFNKDTKYGFIDIDKKESNKIRKACLKDPNMIFTETSNFEGCSEIVRKVTTSKDVTVENLINLNKNKKNKNSKNLVSKSLKNKKSEPTPDGDNIREVEHDIDEKLVFANEELVSSNTDEKVEETGENGLTNESNSDIINIGDEINE